MIWKTGEMKPFWVAYFNKLLEIVDGNLFLD
jgi:hypothetical protein